MLRGLRQLIGEKENSFTTYSYGDVEINVLGEITLLEDRVADIAKNLKLAENNGIKPVSFSEIIKQFRISSPLSSCNLLSSCVYFDGPWRKFPYSNFWRDLYPSEDNKSMIIQRCDIMGNYDVKEVQPVRVNLENPLFTGLYLYKYSFDGRRLPLSDVVSYREHMSKSNNKEYAINDRLSFDGRLVFMADDCGFLKRDDYDPFFSNLPYTISGEPFLEN